MKQLGFTKPTNYHQHTCPYCFKPLGRIAAAKRKLKKVCKCDKCGKIIDERFFVH